MPTNDEANEIYKHLVEQGLIKEPAPPDMTKLTELTERLTKAEAQADVALQLCKARARLGVSERVLKETQSAHRLFTG